MKLESERTDDPIAIRDSNSCSSGTGRMLDRKIRIHRKGRIVD
jgi:hypothetical protein